MGFLEEIGKSLINAYEEVRVALMTDEGYREENFKKCRSLYSETYFQDGYSKSYAASVCVPKSEDFQFIHNSNFDKCYYSNKETTYQEGLSRNRAADKCIRETNEGFSFIDSNFDRCFDVFRERVYRNGLDRDEAVSRCIQEINKGFSFVDNSFFNDCYRTETKTSFGSGENINSARAAEKCIELSNEVLLSNKARETEPVKNAEDTVVSKNNETEDRELHTEAVEKNIEIEKVVTMPAEISVSKVLGETHFKTNGFELTEAAKQILDSIATKMETENGLTIEIIGSTDGEGEDVNNMKLSNKRALYAYEYLTKEKGVDPKRIKQIISKGENEALAEVSEESRSITVRARI